MSITERFRTQDRESAPTDPPVDTRSTGRVEGVDIARGIALLGMASVHVTFTSAGWWTHVAAGRAAVLFFTLSGVALTLIHRRGSTSSSPGSLRRRGAALLLAGLVMALTYWPSSILHYYGVMFLLAPWLLRRSTRTLLLLAAFAIVGGPFVALPGESWMTYLQDSLWEYPVAGFLVSTPLEMAVGLYSLVVWVGFFCVGMVTARKALDRPRSALAIAGIGAAVAVAATLISAQLPGYSHGGGASVSSKNEAIMSELSALDTSETGSDLSIKELSRRIVEKSEALESGKLSPEEEEAARIWLDGKELEYQSMMGPDVKKKKPKKGVEVEVDWNSLNDIESHSNRTPWALQSLGITLAVIGLLCAIPRRLLWPLRPLGALGSITLTAYVLHPILVSDAWVLVRADEHRAREVPTFLGICLVLILGAVLIRRYFRQGPFEWLFKWLSGRPTRATTASEGDQESGSPSAADPERRGKETPARPVE